MAGRKLKAIGNTQYARIMMISIYGKQIGWAGFVPERQAV
jgi:hypothetical protein